MCQESRIYGLRFLCPWQGGKSGSASMVFMGNINQSVDVLLKTSSLFDPFPMEWGLIRPSLIAFTVISPVGRFPNSVQSILMMTDVQEQGEYDSGHIPGAVLLPVGTNDEVTPAGVIPDTDSTVLAYCRRGNRSKTTSSALVNLSYTNIYEIRRHHCLVL